MRRAFSIGGGLFSSALPSGSTAVSISVTLVNEDSAGFATGYAAGDALPLAATVNASAANAVVNNGVIDPIGIAAATSRQ